MRGRHVHLEPPRQDQLWLEGWQAERLAMTYQDLERDPRYRPALQFFLNDIYGARDFSRRDDDVRRVYPLMSRVLSEEAIGSISLAMDLHALSQELDDAVLDVLTGDLGLRPGGPLLPEQYAEAYRRVGRVEDRRRQIEVVVELGRMLDRVVPNPMLYTAVRLAHQPAHFMGFGELQDFVERGFVAFRQMQGADHFLDAIHARETTIHRRLMEGAPAAQWYVPPAQLPLDGHGG